MKVIILAGGWGSRLGQLTETIPKPMVKIGDKPILWHIMKYYAHYGYNDFIISAGVKAQVIKEYFLNYDTYNQNFTKDFSNDKLIIHNKTKEIDWRVTVIDTGLNTLKGARIKRLKHFLEGPTHMVTYGDGLSEINIQELIDFHNKKGKSTLLKLMGEKKAFLYAERLKKNILNKLKKHGKKARELINTINFILERKF